MLVLGGKRVNEHAQIRGRVVYKHSKGQWKIPRMAEKQTRVQLTAVCLVISVLTVVLLVAGPAHGDTATAGTSEEV